MTAFAAIAALFLAAGIALLAWPLLRSGVPSGGRGAALGVAVVLPVAAVLIYLNTSNWDWDAPPPGPGITAPDLQRMVDQLQERIAQQPDDVEGWKLLGRSATVLGSFEIARKAFGEAYTRTQGRDSDALVGYAESLVLVDEREIDGHAAELFEQALALAPDNPRALWYGGIAAFRRGDMEAARDRWVKLQTHDLPPELREVLAAQLAELDVPAEASSGEAQASAASAGIEISIMLDDALAARVPPDARLFVIARRGTGGPPLAVQRRSVGTWPITVRLSDSDAMLPGIRLAGSGPLKLVARISVSGQPIASSGDLYGEVSYDFASAQPASITIDRIVP